MNITNFKKVMIFNRAFDMVSNELSEYNSYIQKQNGVIEFNPLINFRKELFVNSSSIIKLRLDLIKEEITELCDAINQNDIIEQRDACADILYVVYGMADVLGISIDDLFSNKFKTNIINNFKSEFGFESGIDNFTYVKTFVNEYIGFDIKTKNILEMTDIVKHKLNTIYLELETNCNKVFSNEDSTNTKQIPKYSPTNILNENKADYISHNLYELLVWTYIMTLVLNVNANDDFSIVHESNMSKLCDNEEDAKNTIEDYKKKYIAGTSPYDSPYYYYLPNLDKWIVKNLSSGKALKNIKYKKVCFI